MNDDDCGRDLTRVEKAAVRNLILKNPGCANCDRQTSECLPRECKCPMLDLQINTAALCTYFRTAVLPENPELETVFTGTTGSLKTCPICKRRFQSVNNRQIYCPVCRDKGPCPKVR